MAKKKFWLSDAKNLIRLEKVKDSTEAKDAPIGSALEQNSSAICIKYTNSGDDWLYKMGTYDRSSVEVQELLDEDTDGIYHLNIKVAETNKAIIDEFVAAPVGSVLVTYIRGEWVPFFYKNGAPDWIDNNRHNASVYRPLELQLFNPAYNKLLINDVSHASESAYYKRLKNAEDYATVKDGKITVYTLQDNFWHREDMSNTRFRGVSQEVFAQLYALNKGFFKMAFK